MKIAIQLSLILVMTFLPVIASQATPPSSIPADGPSVRWTSDVLAGPSEPSGMDVSEDLMVFQMYEERVFVALDAENGSELWRFEVSGRDEYGDELKPRGDPVIAGEVVILENSGFGFTAVDAKSGEELWSREPTDGTVWQSPIPIDDGTVLSANGDTVYRLQAIDGGVMWERTLLFINYHAGFEGITDIVAFESHALVATSEGLVVSADLETGEITWTTQLPSDSPMDFHGYQDGVNLVAQDGTLFAFRDDGIQIAAHDLLRDTIDTFVDGDTIIFINSSGATAFDLETRSWVWDWIRPTGDSPTIIDGTILVTGCDTGVIEAFDLTNRRQLWGRGVDVPCQMSSAISGVLLDTSVPDERELTLLDPATGEPIWITPVDEVSVPRNYQIEGDTLIGFLRDGTLVVMDLT